MAMAPLEDVRNRTERTLVTPRSRSTILTPLRFSIARQQLVDQVLAMHLAPHAIRDVKEEKNIAHGTAGYWNQYHGGRRGCKKSSGNWAFSLSRQPPPLEYDLIRTKKAPPAAQSSAERVNRLKMRNQDPFGPITGKVP